MSATSIPSKIFRGFAALRGRRAWVACGLLVLLAGLLVMPGRRIWSGWRAAQMRELCERASGLIAEGHYDAGSSMMRRAHQIAPSDPSLLRTLAKSFDLSTPAAVTAVSFWNKLVDSGAASLDDRIELARARLATADPAGAQKVLASLPPQARSQPNCAEVEAALLRDQGREQDADDLLRSVWESHPDDPDCRLKLARVDYFSPFDDSRAEAGRTLWTIARGNGPQVAEALLALLSGSECTAADVAEIRRIVRDDSHIQSPERLSILGGCALRFPLLAREIIAEESSRFGDKSPINCVELYEWLSKLGESDRILRDLSETQSGEAPSDAPAPQVPRDVVFKSRELFLAYGDALILTRRWQAFAALLQRANLPISQTDEELMRALCSRGLNEPDAEGDRHLAAALTFAQRAVDQAALMRVAMTAERMGCLKAAIDATSSISSPNLRLRLENLFRIYRLQTQLGDLDGMIGSAGSILKIRPGLNPYEDDLQYLKLLAGTGMESVLDDLENGPAAERAQSPARLVNRALAAYLCGERTASGQWAASIDPTRLSSGRRAVLAGLLAEAGREIEAFRIVEKLPSETLTADEVRFYQMALR